VSRAKEPPSAFPARVSILGVGVDAVTVSAAVAFAAERLAQRRSAHVVTVNPEYVMAARRDSRFRAVLAASDLAVADGAGIVWAARLLGSPLPERLPGVELAPLLACAAAGEGRGTFLLGAAEGVAERAGAALAAATCPGGGHAGIAGTLSGSPAQEEAGAIASRIRASGAGLVLVAFGAPTQDLWIAEHRAMLGPAICMGVGGTFDYLAGRRRRAPRALRAAGLEWLWRLAGEPWRWRRQLALPRFAAAVVAEAWRGRGRSRPL
jgi:N-acetylglucosaminyldiphosphoundecaprenol N-acetyl-beta-D-mannosaminyltransferase